MIWGLLGLVVIMTLLIGSYVLQLRDSNRENEELQGVVNRSSVHMEEVARLLRDEDER